MSDPASDPLRLHPFEPSVRFDGGNLDCGSGLLLQIRRRIDPLDTGQLLEIRSTEPSVAEDLPAWCRLTGNELVSTCHDREHDSWSFLISKNRFSPVVAQADAGEARESTTLGLDALQGSATSARASSRGRIRNVPEIAPLSVMGIGSWPRPDWLLRALHDRLEGRLPESEFSALADRAVARVVEAQLEAGVDVVTDGEQRRDGYASFVGARFENCQLIPIVDLLPYVEHPDEFARAASTRRPGTVGQTPRRVRQTGARPRATARCA